MLEITLKCTNCGKKIPAEGAWIATISNRVDETLGMDVVTFQISRMPLIKFDDEYLAEKLKVVHTMSHYCGQQCLAEKFMDLTKNGTA
jgi:hypothetical protein